LLQSLSSVRVFARTPERRAGTTARVRLAKRVSLFFAVFPPNYQRARCRVPQKSWAAGDQATKKTAKRPLFRRCFSLFFGGKNSDNRENRIKPIPKLGV